MARATQPSWEFEITFEECEERIVLSADPLPPLMAHALPEQIALELHSEQLSTPELIAPTLSAPLTAPATTPLVRLLGSAARQGTNVGAAWTDVQHVRANLGLTGAGQTVAIIDTGIAWDHLALGGGYGAGTRVVGGWDFAENDGNPYDDGPAGFHGTHVAGIVGSDNSTTPGVATGVDLVALRVFDDSGRGSFGWVEQALQWVHTNRLSFENPITTVNLSIGTTWNAHTVPQWANLEDEFALLKSAGIFISVSAGNDFSSYNTTGVSYPAASPHVVPVASVNSTGTLSSFSQRSDRVLAAPGQQVVSTVPDYLFGADGVKNDFASASGTSMAAPWVAGASTLVREALQRVGQTNITQDTIYNLLRSTADSVFDTFTNANYARVNLRRAVETALASTPPATGNENWGRLASREVTGQGVSGEKWIDVQADRSGYATFEAWFNPGQGNIDLELYRSDGSLASASRSANAGERVDAIGTAGEAFRLRVVGTNSNVTVRFTNLVEAAAGTVRIAGTAADDRHEFRNLGSTSLVLAGGTGYEFNNATFANYRFYGEGGNDTITVHGSAADESAVFASRGVIFTSSNFSVRAENFEISHVYALGGRDIASFRATAGDDTFTGSAASALMSGTGFAQQGYGFEEYSVSFIAGGTDQVILNGSDGDDRFVASPGQAVFTTAGVQHTSLYHDQVTASVGSGNDTAVLRDSVGNDTFTASPGAALLTGDGFRIQADGFERVDALASTGNDIAQFTDSAGQDIFTATPTVSYLTGGGTLNVASGFDSVTAVSQRGGSDIAGFYDSTGDDTLTQIGRTRRLTGSGFAVETRDFAVNVASASNGGQDIVLLQELTRSDFLYGRGSQLHAAGADQFAAYGFERAVAQARSGHRPRVDVAAVDYLFSQG